MGRGGGCLQAPIPESSSHFAGRPELLLGQPLDGTRMGWSVGWWGAVWAEV